MSFVSVDGPISGEPYAAGFSHTTGSASLVRTINTPAGQQVRGLTAAVPEPSLIGLLGMGALMGLRRRRAAVQR